jgi:hypothetical protein
MLVNAELIFGSSEVPVPFIVFPCTFCGGSEERGFRVIVESRVHAYVHYSFCFCSSGTMDIKLQSFG